MSVSAAADTERRLSVALADRMHDLSVRRRGVWLEVPLDQGFIGKMAFGYATWPGHPGWINVLPTIGVFEPALARQIATLKGKTPSGVPLWVYPVSALDHAVTRTWWFSPELDPEKVRALEAMLRGVAIPILRASASLTAIRDHLVAGHSHGAAWNLPVILVALGLTDEARREAHARLEAAVRGEPGPTVSDYAPFVDRFEAWAQSRSAAVG